MTAGKTANIRGVFDRCLCRQCLHELWSVLQLVYQPVLLRTNQPARALFTAKPVSERGIAALLGDSTNLPATSEDLERRACKEIVESRIAVSSAPQHDHRGGSKKGVRTKQHLQAGSACDDTLYRIRV